jgi:hydroxymethylbilane synthase
MNDVVIATRGSQLALWQAEHVRALLQQAEPGLGVSLLVLKTTGDRITDRPLHEVGGKGLFTKEIEEALLDGRAQVAVHSMKDMPGQGPPGLVLAAVPAREDPRDALLCRPGLREATARAAARGLPLAGLPEGATVGTTSLRRVCQLRRLRPDLRFMPLRGNVDSRLRKLDADTGELDAVVLAVAGLTRLGYAGRIDAVLDIDTSLPAVGQGALALQCRADDEGSLRRLRRLADPAAEVAVAAERAFLVRLSGSCKTPLAAHGRVVGERVWLRGLIGAPDGTQVVEDEGWSEARETEAERLGAELAERLLGRGGRELLAAL